MDITSVQNTPEVIATRTGAIHESILRDSPNIDQANFEVLSADDVALMFELYDRHFFDGWLTETMQAAGCGPIALRLSSRMTRSGGTTGKRRPPRRGGITRDCYEIVIASRMLFMTFADVQRAVIVCGRTCRDRLEALQRIMEHEITHLVEMLVWDVSTCSGARFKKLVRSIFGHTDTKHALVTAREHAAERHGVDLGSAVKFTFEGRRLTGRVNRIHHRATVLVPDKDGRRYSDGGTYLKYYIPLGMLTPLGTDEGGADEA